MTIVGVALNAWAAQHFARAVGAVTLDHSGWGGLRILRARRTGLLEGHIYQVFNPWLPWFGAALWRSSAEVGHRGKPARGGALCALLAHHGLRRRCGPRSRCSGALVRSPATTAAAREHAAFMVLYVLWYLSGDAASRESSRA